MGNGNFKAIADVNKLYLLGGAIGIVITITVMLGIKDLSPTASISIILISQLVVAAIIDRFGLFGTQQADFHWTKYVGLAMMIGGVILFKINHKSLSERNLKRASLSFSHSPSITASRSVINSSPMRLPLSAP